MSWTTNETIFYIGIIITGIALLSALIYFCISKIKADNLKAKLDKEYGEKQK